MRWKDHHFVWQFTPAAESHGLWPWMNAPALGRDVAPLGRSLGATSFARGAPLSENLLPVCVTKGVYSVAELSLLRVKRSNRAEFKQCF
jgi:hypothetical protein